MLKKLTPIGPAPTLADPSTLNSRAERLFSSDLPLMVTELNEVLPAIADAAAIAASAAIGTSSATVTTSASATLPLSVGAAWVVQCEAGKSITAGMKMLFKSTADSAVQIAGAVAAYNPTSGQLTLTVSGTSGTGTYTGWSGMVSAGATARERLVVQLTSGSSWTAPDGYKYADVLLVGAGAGGGGAGGGGGGGGGHSAATSYGGPSAGGGGSGVPGSGGGSGAVVQIKRVSITPGQSYAYQIGAAGLGGAAGAGGAGGAMASGWNDGFYGANGTAGFAGAAGGTTSMFGYVAPGGSGGAGGLGGGGGAPATVSWGGLDARSPGGGAGTRSYYNSNYGAAGATAPTAFSAGGTAGVSLEVAAFSGKPGASSGYNNAGQPGGYPASNSEGYVSSRPGGAGGAAYTGPRAAGGKGYSAQFGGGGDGGTSSGAGGQGGSSSGAGTAGSAADPVLGKGLDGKPGVIILELYND